MIPRIARSQLVVSIAAATASLATSTLLQGQPSLAWVTRIDGGNGGEDGAYCIDTDAAGNSVTAGYSWSNGTGYDVLVTKHDVFGNLVWKTTYDAPAHGDDGVAAMTTDGSGNIYLLVNSWGGPSAGYDFLTMKILPDGVIDWTRRYNGPGSGEEGIYGFDQIGLDAAGSVYVSGYSLGSAGFYEYATIKYNNNGAPQWLQRFASPFPANPDAYAYAMAVTPGGDVYVSGDAVTPAGLGENCVVKYDSAGVLQWSAFVDPANGREDSIYDLQLDSAGNLLMTGISYDPNGGLGVFTAKCDSAGSTLWSRIYAGGGFDYGWNMTTNVAGDAVVAAGLDTSVGYKLLTLNYDTNGNLQWAQRYDSGWAGDEFPSDVGVDSQGNVVVAGTTWNGFANSDDLIVAKYAGNGAPLWVESWNAPVSGQDSAFDLDIDALDQVVIAGYSLGLGTSTDFCIWKYRDAKPDLEVSPNPPQSGSNATFTATRFEPNQATYLLYSTSGLGSTPINALKVSLDISNPTLLGSVNTDATGTAMWTKFIPAPAAGLDVWLQAAQYGQTSEVLSVTIQ